MNSCREIANKNYKRYNNNALIDFPVKTRTCFQLFYRPRRVLSV